MIAIHNNRLGFTIRWIEYCEENHIPYKLVDCYANDIVDQLVDCKALLWHFTHYTNEDILFAKQILYSLQHTGLKVFPDFFTSWHFDDKIGQKYLFERLGIPHIPTYVFYKESEAREWVNSTTFPKVLKLKAGSGSQNVFLIHNVKEAHEHVKKLFSKGISKYNSWNILKDRYKRYLRNEVNLFDVLKGLVRLVIKPSYANSLNKENSYVYFQDFVPNNQFDIRIIVIGKYAFGIKRFVRENDFRASGSGLVLFNKEEIPLQCVELSFKISKELNTQCSAYDYIFNEDEQPLLVELSYGFLPNLYDKCPGYWTEDLNWFESNKFKENYIIDNILDEIK